MKNQVLIAHNLLPLSQPAEAGAARSKAALGTVLANLASYGYAPNVAALAVIRKLSDEQLVDLWRGIEPALRELTGANREMAKFVVYKNFPQEVLDMSQAQYWTFQVLMYVGAPNEWFCEKEAERAPLNEKLTLKVLAPAQASSLRDIYAELVANKARWTDAQKDYARFLVGELAVADLTLSDFGFKENGLLLMAASLDTEGSITLDDATDVLRLAVAMSDGDISMREQVSLRSFTRAERRFLLDLLEHTKNLRADAAARPDLFKRLLNRLHPGDFKCPNVSSVYDALYKGELTSFNSDVEARIGVADESVLQLLRSRPGEYLRRLHKLYALFGMPAVHAAVPLFASLTTLQLLKLKGYVRTVNGRAKLMYAPKGNWSKAKVVDNEKKAFSGRAVNVLLEGIETQLGLRLAEAFPGGVQVGERLSQVKLQTNDQELAPYGRGTVFDIPADATFLRTASYWKTGGGNYCNIWYDNGVNFFDEDWKPKGTCCWNVTDFKGAVFSGDPTNSKEMQGRACQMIDLYPDQLVKHGVRYAVWNVLCFSKQAFGEAQDVLATLQWGTDAKAGKLFEPARAQMVFPLRGAAMTKFVAYIDLVERKLIYMDANFPGDVSSASSNAETLANQMPAYVEYLESLPSVADLVSSAPQGKTPFLYTDEGVELEKGALAYVFRPANPANSFEPVKLAQLL